MTKKLANAGALICIAVHIEEVWTEAVSGANKSQSTSYQLQEHGQV